MASHTVHHRPVIAVGGGEQEQTEETEVQLQKMRLLIPPLAVLREQSGHLIAYGLGLYRFDTHDD